MRHEVRRSLMLHYAVAGKLVADPEAVRDVGRRNLAHLRSVHRPGTPLTADFDAWGVLLDGPLEDLLVALTEVSGRGTRMRVNAPFAGVLTDAERAQVLGAFMLDERRRRAPVAQSRGV